MADETENQPPSEEVNMGMEHLAVPQEPEPHEVFEFQTDTEFDNFVNILEHILAKANHEVSEADVYVMSRFPAASAALKQQGYRRDFHGQLKNFKVRLLPPESDRDISFLVDASMTSTGRGEIGIMKRLMRLHYSESKSYFSKILSRRRHSFGLTVKKLNEDDIKAALENLKTQSQNESYKAKQQALRSQVYAGLPGLGKRN